MVQPRVPFLDGNRSDSTTPQSYKDGVDGFCIAYAPVKFLVTKAVILFACHGNRYVDTIYSFYLKLEK